jgi:phosphatidylinositol 4-kinase B
LTSFVFAGKTLCVLGQREFVCLVCLVFCTGNILLDADGHIVHIDFGYLLTVAPGGVQFERSPFKLTSEFADVLGGPSSKLFRRFRGLCVQAFIAARKRRDQLLVLVEMMLASNSSLPCFVKGAKAVMSELNDRFLPDASKRQCEVFVNGLIDA